MKHKILVTGADGFIGSHLVEKLVQCGESVKAFVYYNSLNTWGWLDDLPKKTLKEIEVITGDIRDPYGIKNALTDCSSVYHLAALIAIPFSYYNPATYVDTNVKGTLHVLQAAKELNIEKIIHTSTSEVYGTAQFVPISEDHPLQAQSPYSASKIGADQIALSFHRSFGTPVSVIRPFNTYGPRQSARAVIPTIITQIAAGNDEIMLGDLQPTRDFSYIDDTVSGFLAVANSPNSVGTIINIGSGFEISIGETAKIISEILGKKINIKEDSQRIRPTKSEVMRLYADISKAKKLLDWIPQYANIDGFKRGLQQTASWFLEQKNIQKYKNDIYNL